MNERIKELAIQNKFIHSWMPPGEQYDLLRKYEAFAESIVQRTLAIVEAHTEIFQSDEARAMVEHIKHSVKTDFGVE